MKNVLIKMTGVILAGFMLANCGMSRGDEVGTRAVDETTNNLENPLALDLVLDQIRFEGHIGSDAFVNNHPDLEIHIMDASEEKLLACVGAAQEPTLNYLGEAKITYGQLNAVFVKAGNAALESNTPIVVRLVRKWAAGGCPSGYVGRPANPNPNQSNNYDETVAKVETTFGALTQGEFAFPGVAHARFRKDNGDPFAIPQTAPVAGKQIYVDQVFVADRDLAPGESSQAELALLVVEEGVETPLGCSELYDIDIAGILYGTLDYPVTHDGDHGLFLSDLNTSDTYRLKLVELDNGGCADVLEEGSPDVGITTLASTVGFHADGLVGVRMNLAANAGYVVLTSL